MPRIAGQVDETKTEAILDAASELFADKGTLASMEAIARRAGVSRQTLYNRFPSKTEIGRALAARRSDALTAALRSGGDPERVLTDLARALLEKLCVGHARGSMRGVILMSPQAPDLAEAVYRAGPEASMKRLAEWIADQTAKGRLAAPDPLRAAEMFAGMVLGHGHLRAVMGLEEPACDIEARAADAARRFLRAFAP